MARESFYVGYLPLPAPLRRFVWVLVPLLLVALVAVAWGLTAQQGDPGDGVWDLGEPITVEGVLLDEPYAMVQGVDGSTRPLLLVTMGKVGGEAFVRGRANQPVRVTGFPIGRGGATLLALESNDAVTGGDAARHVPRVSLGPRSLDGQIIDPKCYFGAMKPGEGKVHKACATLCIAGGIPPMFMTTDDAGRRTYYLLVDDRGHGITGDTLDALLPFVADPVTIAGEAERWGEMLLLRIDPATIKRR